MGGGCSFTIEVAARRDDRRRSPSAWPVWTHPVPPLGGRAEGYDGLRASTRRRSVDCAGDRAGAGGPPGRRGSQSRAARRAALRRRLRADRRAAHASARGGRRGDGLRRRRPGARLHGHRADPGRPRTLQPGGDPQRAAGHAAARRLRRHGDGGCGRGRRHRPSHPGDHADRLRPRDRRDPGADRRCDPQRARAYARGAEVRAADRRAARPRRRARGRRGAAADRARRARHHRTSPERDLAAGGGREPRDVGPGGARHPGAHPPADLRGARPDAACARGSARVETGHARADAAAGARRAAAGARARRRPRRRPAPGRRRSPALGRDRGLRLPRRAGVADQRRPPRERDRRARARRVRRTGADDRGRGRRRRRSRPARRRHRGDARARRDRRCSFAAGPGARGWSVRASLPLHAEPDPRPTRDRGRVSDIPEVAP